MTALVLPGGLLEIGIDVDDVLAKLLRATCDHINTYHFDKVQHLGLKGVQPYMFRQYSLRDTIGWEENDAQYHKEFAGSPEYRRIEPVEGSVEGIRYLTESSRISKRIRLHAVTNRRPHTKEFTSEWIQKHYGDAFDGRIHIMGGANGDLGLKAVECAKLNLSIVAEDQAEQADAMALAGMHVVLFSKKWNEGFNVGDEKYQGRIARVAGWTEGREKIEETAARMLQV